LSRRGAQRRLALAVACRNGALHAATAPAPSAERLCNVCAGAAAGIWRRRACRRRVTPVSASWSSTMASRHAHLRRPRSDYATCSRGMQRRRAPSAAHPRRCPRAGPIDGRAPTASAPSAAWTTRRVRNRCGDAATSSVVSAPSTPVSASWCPPRPTPWTASVAVTDGSLPRGGATLGQRAPRIASRTRGPACAALEQLASERVVAGLIRAPSWREVLPVESAAGAGGCVLHNAPTPPV
jgi:hypothetical protein